MNPTQLVKMPHYVCPQSHLPLKYLDGALCTPSGKFTYPVKVGTPRFLRFPAAEDSDTVASLERLNRIALESGWQSALGKIYGAKPNEIRYLTDVGRASFIGLLPLTATSDVLEIGPGLGQFTAQLAGRARTVSAIEVVAGQADFAAERCRQEGLTNVQLAVGGDDCRLPYGDEAFDLVVLNLVFEWCASRCEGEAPLDVQRRLLAEIDRVSRPGGTLYLATKNRFAVRYLIGKPDEHFYSQRFGSALPRWLGRLLLQAGGHAAPMGLLHSHDALEEMLLNAGYASIESFWATPEMRYPTEYVRTDAPHVREARRRPGFIQGEGRSTRLVMRLVPAALVRHFTPGLAFLATKASRPVAG